MCNSDGLAKHSHYQGPGLPSPHVLWLVSGVVAIRTMTHLPVGVHVFSVVCSVPPPLLDPALFSVAFCESFTIVWIYFADGTVSVRLVALPSLLHALTLSSFSVFNMKFSL